MIEWKLFSQKPKQNGRILLAKNVYGKYWRVEIMQYHRSFHQVRRLEEPEWLDIADADMWAEINLPEKDVKP